MNLLRPGSAFLTLALLAAIATPVAADQVFSSVSTGPVRTYATAPPYPIGDIYYSPCGWYGNSGNFGGGSGFGRSGRGGRGSTTLTGERFYPFDIGSNGNRIGGHSGNRGFSNAGCGQNSSPAPHQRIPMPRASPRR
jgi:hypothetical protein